MSDCRRPLVSQKDIARELGVSVSAVSMALRNHPRVSDELKAKVKAEAKRLKYNPDPVLSALVAYREQNRIHAKRMVSIALLVPSLNWQEEVYWFKEVFKGIKERVKNLGYDLDVYPYPKDNAGLCALCRKFRNIGVKGILLGPSYGKALPPFPIEGFSVVRLSHSIGDARLSICSHDHFQGMELACRQAFAKGYRNLAYIFDGELERRLGKRWLASFGVGILNGGHTDLNSRSFELSGDVDRAPLGIRDWLDRIKPDCLIAPMSKMLKAGFLHYENDRATWKKIGKIALALETRTDPDIVGIRQNFKEVGCIGVDLLHEQLMEQKTGYLRYPRWVFIPGDWIDGSETR